MSENVIWPTKVETYADDIIEVIKDIIDYKEVSAENLKKYLCELALQKFLDSDELILTEAEFEEVYTKALTQTSLDKLIAEGMITFVEDNDGEMLYLLTDKGKEIAQLLPDITFNDVFERLN